MTRAPAMPPDERRAALIAATLPLLRDKGMAVSTREIARAAGVAEGTIFRVFKTKEDLIQAALGSAFDVRQLIEGLEAIDMSLPLRDRLVAGIRILQGRLMDVFALMASVGMVRPPERVNRDDARQAAWRKRSNDLVIGLIAPDADRLSVTPERLAHLLRLLTFSGSHAQIAEGGLLTPEEIVDTILNGHLKESHTNRGNDQ